MCHLILLMPVLAIPLFWFVPLSVAAPVYSVILIVSGGMYYLMLRVMQRPVKTGTEALVHSIGEVVGKEGDLFRVRAQGEIWNAESTDKLRPGDRIEVIGVKGLRLKVRCLSRTGAAPLVQG
jgi:membrane protein implicated in regulation of membrane protease activity